MFYFIFLFYLGHRSLYLDALVAVTDHVKGDRMELGRILSEEGYFLLSVEVLCLGGFRYEFMPCFLACTKGGEAWDCAGGHAASVSCEENRVYD